MESTDDTANPWRIGIRIESHTDLRLVQWLIHEAGEGAVRTAAAELTARRKPRPERVVIALGLALPSWFSRDVPGPEVTFAHKRPAAHARAPHAVRRPSP